MRQLREQGGLVPGARYANKGLVFVGAANEAEPRAVMRADPSMQAQFFSLARHEFRVFYGGSVRVGQRSPTSP